MRGSNRLNRVGLTRRFDWLDLGSGEGWHRKNRWDSGINPDEIGFLLRERLLKHGRHWAEPSR